MQNIITKVKDIWSQVYDKLTVDMLLYTALALLLLAVIALIVSAARARKIEALEIEIETLSRAKQEVPAPAQPVQAVQPVQAAQPVPVQVVESPCADRVLEMARQLCDTADTAYETACREMDEQAQRTRAFYRMQQDKAYAMLKELRAGDSVFRLPNPVKEEKTEVKVVKDDPDNLGSLDDLDEE